MLELILLVVGMSLLYLLLKLILLLLRDLPRQGWLRLKGRIILNVDSILASSSTGKASIVNKVDHFLADYRHLKNLSDRRAFLSIFVQHCID
jgi:hypothetical protein